MTTIGTPQAEPPSSELALPDVLKSAAAVARNTSRPADTMTRLPATERTAREFTNTPVPLSTPKPNLNLMLMLQRVQVQLDQRGIETGKEDIQKVAQANKQHHKEVMEALQKSIAEMEKSKKSGMFAKVFGWIAAVATVAAGAMMALTGAGLAMSAVMIGLAVDQMVGLATGNSGLGKLTTAIADGLKGMGEPLNMIVATIIVMAIVIIGTSCAGSAANAMSSMAGAAKTAGGKVASKLPQSVTQRASQVADKLPSMPQMPSIPQASNGSVFHQVRDLSLCVTAATQMGSASANMHSAVHKKEADDARVEELQVRKVITQNKAYIENTIDHLQKLTQDIEGVVQHMVSFINQEQKTNQKLIKDMA